jgi:ABC-type branched-subunit amino acid transport system ATPase component
MLESLRASGYAILLVEHDMKLVMRLCPRILVLNFGRLIGAGTPAEVRANREVVDAYLGTSD